MSLAWLTLGSTTSDEVSIAAIETAHRSGSLPDLASLAQLAIAHLAAADEDEEVRRRYALALIAWRANHLWKDESDGDRASAEQLLIARQQLETILERDPAHVEALTLRSAVLGELSEASLLSRIKLGAVALRSLERAKELAPNNPRVALQSGVFLLHTPRFAGGGPEAALTELERAYRLFSTQTEPAPWPDWGRVDAAAWLGQTLATLGRVEEARSRYREGLATPPPSPWIRDTLLPALPRRERSPDQPRVQ